MMLETPTAATIVALTQETSLRDAKEWLRQRVEKGVDCPCCNQLAKVYTRKLYASMAAALLFFYKNFESTEWHSKAQLIARSGSLATTFGGGDFAKLAYWGLIDDDDPAKRTSGLWQITGRGGRFVRREITVPSHIRLYDGKCLGFSEEQVTIDQCLGKKFNYSELMGETDQKLDTLQ